MQTYSAVQQQGDVLEWFRSSVAEGIRCCMADQRMPEEEDTMDEKNSDISPQRSLEPMGGNLFRTLQQAHNDAVDRASGDPMFVGGMAVIAERVRAVNAANGWDQWGVGVVSRLAELALVISEVAEMMEVLRKENWDTLEDKLFEEGADVVIRLLDFFNRYENGGARLARAIVDKIEKNKTRGYRHGGKRA